VISQQSSLFNFICRRLKSVAALMALTASLLVAGAFGQKNNPVPQIVGPTYPSAVLPGGPGFTLHVYGANFMPNATVNWNGQPRATTYISGHELDAQVLASDIATPTAGLISVTNQSPNGPRSSNATATYAQVEVHTPTETFSSGPPTIYWGLESVNYVADINGDGYLDLMSFPHLRSTVQALINNGDGTFHGGPFLTFDAYLDSYPIPLLALGDFNGDGQLDLVYDKGEDIPQTQVTDLAVNFGNGDSNFIPGPTSARYQNPKNFTVEYPGEGVVGDFNRDGLLDVAVLPWVGFSLSIYQGNGDGTFSHGGQFHMPVGGNIVAGDFNNDGNLDFVGFGNTNSGIWTLGVMLGNGDGTFGPEKEIGTATQTPSAFFGVLQATDLNEDGNLDIVFSNGTGVGVLLGNGDGTFQPPVYYTTPLVNQVYITMVVADFNSDGHQDVMIGDGYQAWLLMGQGDGTLKLGKMLTCANGFITGTAADFNADGLVDVVVTVGGPNGAEGTAIFLGK
jgi:hypothetical protein